MTTIRAIGDLFVKRHPITIVYTVLGPMVRHDLTEITREGQRSGKTKQSHVPLFEIFQQIRERMEAIAKGIVLDHWSTVI